MSLRGLVHRQLSRLRIKRLDPGRPWQLPEDPLARQEAVMWAHRLLRGREPDSAEEIASLAAAVRDLGELRGRLAPGTPAAAWALPADPEGRREAARWAYRTILLREPDSEEALDFLATRSTSARDMRDRLLQSPEARARAALPVHLSMTGDEPPQSILTEVTPAKRERFFRRVQDAWRALGKEKPHWSVATVDDFRPDRIEESLEAFYATGEDNVRTLLRTLERNGVDPAGLAVCMDFGCGVGRLSVALSRAFREVVAVDVSESHLELAKEALRRRGVRNVSTRHLPAIGEVAALPAVDLVYSVIVLQHNPPPVIRELLAGLMGRLNPGGVAVFQVPTYLPAGYAFDPAKYEDTEGGQMEMHGIAQREVFALARGAGLEVLEVLEDAWTGFGAGSRSNTFVLRRPAG